jgi:hypothetical protein|tara:strand:+ start:44 stop:409 length:366 start_codon:yes stop_codon:yes gene_type:complete
MIKLKTLINESNVWDRKFGEPLPTLTDIMSKKDVCCDNCTEGKVCCSVTESSQDIAVAKKKFLALQKAEGVLRSKMFDLEQAFLADARPENVKLAKELKNSYVTNVTTFMKEAVKFTKGLK